MAVTLQGLPPADVTAKDVMLNIIAMIGTGGGQGHIIEYRGPAVEQMTMESRMTVCNMSIEAGARAGLIQPDETTFTYLRGRRFAPTGSQWDEAVESWSALRSDPGARFDKDVAIDAQSMRPFVTWGTNPAQGVPIDAAVPDPSDLADPEARTAAERALRYMDLAPGTPMRDVSIDTVFVGSCTNGRLEDLRAAAAVLRGRHVAPTVKMIVVPGSARVRVLAEQEGLADVFRSAGAEWRHAGCSMCLSMNPDRLSPGQRSASTSNRNFEGRQGAGARTHLVSPAVAAASAVIGRITAPSDL
jgi:3-isopropylmalate/(R)-2-methylmalate dehydratase large subunit